jgi:hypothetical protein
MARHSTRARFVHRAFERLRLSRFVMKNILLLSLLALLCVPPRAHAQTYRCVQANGSIAFQDHPCQVASKGSTIDVAPVQGYSSDGLSHSLGEDAAAQAAQRNSETAKENEHVKAYNAQIEAANKERRCQAARHDLGVLKDQVPVYNRDNQGNRIYIEDKDRPAMIAAAEQRVATDCR